MLRDLMSDDAPKSAYELAMARLRRKDAEAGVVTGPISDEQKAEIADVRSRAEARIAELKILHQSKAAAIFDPDARALADAELRRDVQRVEEDRESKIARIREGRR
jgi:hypothetical protein